MWERLRRALALDRFARGIEIPDTGSIGEGEARSVELGPVSGDDGGRTGIEMAVLCRVEGKLFALAVRCPHEGGTIVDGPLIDGRYAVCPLHHFLFDPRTGRQKEGFCGPARRYRLVERDGVATLYPR